MNAPGNQILTTGLGMLMLIILCYVGGRLHQWYKHTMDREEAFRDGYNTATRSLFSLATRIGRELNVARSSSVQRAFEPGIARGAAPVPLPNHTKPPVAAIRPLNRNDGPRHRARQKKALPITKRLALDDLRSKNSA